MRTKRAERARRQTRFILVCGLLGGGLGGLFPSTTAAVAIWEKPAAGCLPVTYKSSPLSSKEIIAQLGSITGRQPSPSGRRGAVFEGGDGSAEGYFRISVHPDGAGIEVAFLVGGDYGLALAREFFEAPFFLPDETRRLYEMFNRASSQPRAEEAGRLTISMSLVKQSGMWLLSIHLAPRG